MDPQKTDVLILSLAEPISDLSALEISFDGEIEVTETNTYLLKETAALAIVANNNNSISVYPNPSTEYIIIEGLKNINKVQIYSSTGSLVKIVAGNNISKLKISDLPAGLYIINASSNNAAAVSRIIKK